MIFLQVSGTSYTNSTRHFSARVRLEVALADQRRLVARGFQGVGEARVVRGQGDAVVLPPEGGGHELERVGVRALDQVVQERAIVDEALQRTRRHRLEPGLDARVQVQHDAREVLRRWGWDWETQGWADQIDADEVLS